MQPSMAQGSAVQEGVGYSPAWPRVQHFKVAFSVLLVTATIDCSPRSTSRAIPILGCDSSDLSELPVHVSILSLHCYYCMLYSVSVYILTNFQLQLQFP